MGSYLSSPITEKHNKSGNNESLSFAVAEMQGWRTTMEDASLAQLQIDEATSLFGVFDGHGGKEVAHFVVAHFTEELLANANYQSGDLPSALRETFLRMDERLLSAEGNREIHLMINDLPKDTGVDTSMPFENRGCTAVVALLRGSRLIVANAGDSRCVLSRDGCALELSEDHKPELPKERARIEKAGGSIENGRVNGGLNLSRSLGDLDYKRQSELRPEEQLISAFPDVTETELVESDAFLILACDGVWEQYSSQEVVGFLAQRTNGAGDLAEVLNALFDRCIALSPQANEGRGCDNMTALLVQFSHH